MVFFQILTSTYGAIQNKSPNICSINISDHLRRFSFFFNVCPSTLWRVISTYYCIYKLSQPILIYIFLCLEKRPYIQFKLFQLCGLSHFNKMHHFKTVSLIMFVFLVFSVFKRSIDIGLHQSPTPNIGFSKVSGLNKPEAQI